MKESRNRTRVLKYLFLVLFIVLAIAYLLVVLLHDTDTTDDYTEFDKERAVITCMTAEYATRYTDDPAESDMFPECEKRYEKLKATLPYSEYMRFLKTPVSAEAGPNEMQPYEVYLQIMTGQDR